MNLARRDVRGLLRLLVAGSLLALAGVATAQDPGQPEVRLEASAGEIEAVAGQPVELTVVKTRGGSPVVGEPVDWAPEVAESGRIEVIDELTRAAASDAAAGSARARFIPDRPGRHGITVRTPVEAGCRGSDCRMVASRIVVIAASAPAAGSGGGRDGTGALIVAGGAVAAMALMASGDDDTDLPGAQMVLRSGNGQSALANSPLPNPLVVESRVNGRADEGAVVLWTATGGAVLSAAQTRTSVTGVTSVEVVSVGPGPGPVTITATRADDPHATVSFTADVDIAGLDLVSGDNQSTQVDTTTAAPLVVRAELNGDPQAGVALNWQIFGGGTLSGVVSTTNGSGLAQAFVDVGSFPGTITVVVSRVDSPGISQVFTVNAVELRDLVYVSGNGQTVAQNQPVPLPLAVQALDNGAGDGGVTILWSADGGATLSSNSTVTDPAGFSNVTVTDVGPGLGPVTVTATRADVPMLSVSFTINIDPATLTVTGGDNQSGLVGTAAPLPVQVQLLDGNGAPMAGETIFWNVVSGSTATLDVPISVTDAGGFAEATFTFGPGAGPFEIEASAFSGAVATAPGAVGTSQGPTSVTPGGDGATGNAGATLTITLDINSTTAGVPVTFQVIDGDATVSPASTVTDAGGIATADVLLGDLPGPVQVLATAPGGQTHIFNLTIAGDREDVAIAPVSGDGQELDIGVQSAPLVIEVLDDEGDPIVGQTVHWSTTNGTLEFTTTTTGADGRTQNRATLTSAGPAVVTASFPSGGVYVGSSIVFNLNGPLASVPNLPVNEASVAEALDSACGALSGGGPLTPAEQDLLAQCNALAAASGSDPEAVEEALEQMLPDVAQTQADAGQAAIGAQFDNLNGRIVQLRSGAPMAQFSFNGLNLAMSGGQMPLGQLGTMLLNADPADAPQAGAGFSKWGFFMSGNIGRGESDPTSLTPEYDFDINGLTAGIDYRYNDSLVLGLALGYTSQDTDLANGQGSVDTEGFSVSAYTTWYSQNEWYFDGVLTWSNNSYDHERRIQYVLPGSVVDQVAIADSDGDDLSATLTFGRDWAIRGWTVGAYARAQYTSMSFDEFQEEVDVTAPGAGLALRVESRDVSGYSAILGGKLAYAHSASWGVLVPQFDIEWQNDFQSDAEAFRGYFVDDPTGTPILVLGDDLDSNFFKVSLGLSMVLTGGRSGFITYESWVARSGMSQEMLTLGFRMEF